MAKNLTVTDHDNLTRRIHAIDAKFCNPEEKRKALKTFLTEGYNDCFYGKVLFGRDGTTHDIIVHGANGCTSLIAVVLN